LRRGSVGDAAKIYMHPSLQQVFDFVKGYVDYYKTGAGSSHAQGALRWRNAERVRFNIRASWCEVHLTPLENAETRHRAPITSGRNWSDRRYGS
jgi:glycerophosphoryl diester phosphodiesterase